MPMDKKPQVPQAACPMVDGPLRLCRNTPVCSLGGWGPNLTSTAGGGSERRRPLLGAGRHDNHPARLADGPGASLEVLPRPARLGRGGKPTGIGAAIANLSYLGITLAAMPFSWLEAAMGRGASVMVHARPKR